MPPFLGGFLLFECLNVEDNQEFYPDTDDFNYSKILGVCVGFRFALPNLKLILLIYDPHPLGEQLLTDNCSLLTVNC